MPHALKLDVVAGRFSAHLEGDVLARGGGKAVGISDDSHGSGPVPALCALTRPRPNVQHNGKVFCREKRGGRRMASAEVTETGTSRKAGPRQAARVARANVRNSTKR